MIQLLTDWFHGDYLGFVEAVSAAQLLVLTNRLICVTI